MINPYAKRTHEEMKDVLKNPSLLGPKIHYRMIRGGKKLGNITIWVSGKIGDEYIKSYGHYHVSDFDETYKIISGEGIVITQTREIDEHGRPIDDKLSEFRARIVHPGDRVNIPKRAGHLMINIGKKILITKDDSPVDFKKRKEASFPSHADYNPFKKLHGAGYYVIEKDGKPTLERNPFYSKVPEAKIE